MIFLVTLYFLTGFETVLLINIAAYIVLSLPGWFVLGSICLRRHFSFKVEKLNFTFQNICHKTGQVWRQVYTSKLQVWSSIETAASSHFKTYVWRSIEAAVKFVETVYNKSKLTRSIDNCSKSLSKWRRPH